MVPKSSKCHSKPEHGFSLAELMVVLAIAAILIGIAVPNVQNWRRNYNIKSAVTDLYAAMQSARLGAIKSNRPWTMIFQSAPIPRYEIRDADNNSVRQVLLKDRYRSAITYGSPTGAGPIDLPTMTFNPSGLLSDGVINRGGFVYLQGSTTLSYYRVGMLYSSSAAKIQRWNGTTWQ